MHSYVYTALVISMSMCIDNLDIIIIQYRRTQRIFSFFMGSFGLFINDTTYKMPLSLMHDLV